MTSFQLLLLLIGGLIVSPLLFAALVMLLGLLLSHLWLTAALTCAALLIRHTSLKLPHLPRRTVPPAARED